MIQAHRGSHADKDHAFLILHQEIFATRRGIRNETKHDMYWTSFDRINSFVACFFP